MNSHYDIASLEAQAAHLRAHYDRAVANGWREAADWAYELSIVSFWLRNARAAA